MHCAQLSDKRFFFLDLMVRLLPYHVFADLELEEDEGIEIDATVMTQKSSAQESEDKLNAQMEHLLAEFEKQVLAFNVMTRQRAEGTSRAEEQVMLEVALLNDERQQTERVRAAIAQQNQQEQQEAARARLAIAQAQAAAAGVWPQQAAQASVPSWQHALAAAAAAARGQGSPSGGQVAMAPPSPVFMQQQVSPHQQQHQEMTMAGGTWQALAASRGEGCTGGQAMIQAMMMQQLQQQQQQQQQLQMMAAAARGEGGSVGGQALTPAMVMQLLHQQQQEMMAAGTWQMGGRQGYVTPCGDGSSSSQSGAVMQQQQPGQVQATTMALPWHSSAERSEQ